MGSLRFRSMMQIEGINPYVLVSARRAARLQKNWRKPLPVRVRVNGKPDEAWRINLMPVGDGSFYLYLHGDIREVSNTKVGDVLCVELEFDDEYKGGPAHPMPSWFRDALDSHPDARQTWSRLVPSRQKEILRYFSWLKTSQAQVRNTQRAIYVLSGGKGRFMGRTWNQQQRVRAPRISTANRRLAFKKDGKDWHHLARGVIRVAFLRCVLTLTDGNVHPTLATYGSTKWYRQR